MFYRNASYTVKTFYGVTFQPGETKEVNGQINNKWMILVNNPKTSPKQQLKPSSEKPEEANKNKQPESLKAEAKETAEAKDAPKSDKKDNTKPAESK